MRYSSSVAARFRFSLRSSAKSSVSSAVFRMLSAINRRERRGKLGHRLIILGFDLARSITHCVQSQLDVGTRRAKVNDAGAQREFTAQHRVRKICAAAALYFMHDAFVQTIEPRIKIVALVIIVCGGGPVAE